MQIQVQDFGEGISPEKLERIFERFYRGDGGSIAPGFGLGLPIAKALVDAQNGEIKLESSPGQGSVVILRFPTA